MQIFKKVQVFTIIFALLFTATIAHAEVKNIDFVEVISEDNYVDNSGSGIGEINAAAWITFVFASWETHTIPAMRSQNVQTAEEDEKDIEDQLEALWRQGTSGDIRKITHVDGVPIEKTKWAKYGGDIPVTNPYPGGRNPLGLPVPDGKGGYYEGIKSDDRVPVDWYIDGVPTDRDQEEPEQNDSNYSATKITVIVDNEPVFFPDQEPIMLNYRTMVPMRAVFEHFNVQTEVEWDNIEKEVTGISRQGTTVIFKIDDRDFTIADVSGVVTTKETDVPATIKNNRTLLPLRAFSEALGLTVQWYQDTKVVDIRTNTDFKRALMSKRDWETYLEGVRAEQ